MGWIGIPCPPRAEWGKERELPAASLVYNVRAVNIPDDELVLRTIRGDGQAFGLLVERHTPVVYRIIRRMCSDRAEAEAITQEAFLRAWESLDRSKDPPVFLPWVIRIAVNAGRDMLKKSRPMDFADLPGEEVQQLADPGMELEQAVDEGEILERLGEAVQALPLPYRTVIALRYEAEMSYEQMADVLGLPLNTVRTRLHRAKERLRGALEDER
jgi:RNA polymerase sigma-70 factor (ECF subfamily)